MDTALEADVSKNLDKERKNQSNSDTAGWQSGVDQKHRHFSGQLSPYSCLDNPSTGVGHVVLTGCLQLLITPTNDNNYHLSGAVLLTEQRATVPCWICTIFHSRCSIVAWTANAMVACCTFYSTTTLQLDGPVACRVDSLTRGHRFSHFDPRTGHLFHLSSNTSLCESRFYWQESNGLSFYISGPEPCGY